MARLQTLLFAWIALGMSSRLFVDSSDLHAAYLAEALKVGERAEDQIRLALWCEAHQLPAERSEHLNKAIKADPKNGLARSLLGQMEDGGRWRNPGEVTARVAEDAALAEGLAK